MDISTDNRTYLLVSVRFYHLPWTLLIVLWSEWEQIPAASFYNLVESLPGRVETVTAADWSLLIGKWHMYINHVSLRVKFVHILLGMWCLRYIKDCPPKEMCWSCQCPPQKREQIIVLWFHCVSFYCVLWSNKICRQRVLSLQPHIQWASIVDSEWMKGKQRCVQNPHNMNCNQGLSL